MHLLQLFRKECEELCGEYARYLEEPKEYADLALPCFRLGKNPQEIAKQLEKELKQKIGKDSLIKDVEAVGPYLNFHINNKKFSRLVVAQILKEKEKYGSGVHKKEKIMIEYSGPNTNKPLHVGHLRNDSIGMAVSNLLEFLGYKVIRTNILNDRGVHICKAMLAYKKWGNSLTPKKAGRKPDHFVGNFYVMFEQKARQEPQLEEEARRMLLLWEKGDKETRTLWKKMNGWTLKGMKQTYKLFGSRFDLWPLESVFYKRANPIIEEGLEKGILFKNNKGDIVAKLEPALPNKVVLRADGTSIYITNDLALTKYRFEKYKIDKMIWCVASEQNLYFQQLFKIFELLGYEWSKNCYHLSYGLVNLPSGRMKTREGTVIDADNLIEDVKELAEEEIKKRYVLKEQELKNRALWIALGAIKYYLLNVDPPKDILFDSEEAVKFEGDTGPYLQYTYARANSILKKSKKKPAVGELHTESEFEIVKKIAKFSHVLEKAAKELKPNYIANYLFELATLFNKFYHETRVIGSKEEQQRLALVAAVAQVLKNGLTILGIKAIEKM